MPRVVLDTNVLVSALITPHGASARLLVELRAGAFEVIVCPALLRELRDVLDRAKLRRYVTPIEADAYVRLVERTAISIADPARSGPSVIREKHDYKPWKYYKGQSRWTPLPKEFRRRG